MRIGISCLPTAGGSGIVAAELGVALAERGHEVHFVTYDAPFRLKQVNPFVFSHTVAIVPYPQFRYPPLGFALTTRIAEVADEHNVEIWHAHYAMPHAAAALFAREMLPPHKRFKLVTTLHGTDITLVANDPSYFRLTKFAMERGDAVTAVSQWLNEETQREFQLERPIRTIHNFVNPDRFQGPRLDRNKLAEPGEKILMHVSNFRPVKRVTDVVRVFKRVADQVPARLVLVGDGPERMMAIGVAKQLGIASQVTHLGEHDNVESIIPCADLLLQPSEHESFGLVPLEAMLCGVPVLGTASGGICEVVENGVTGFLCEVGDIETMAARAVEVLTNPDRAKEMGRRGRERALSLFARDRIVDQYEALYCEVLTEDSPAPQALTLSPQPLPEGEQHE